MILLILEGISSDEEKVFMIDVYKNYSGLIRGTIFKMNRTQNDLDDLESEVILKLMKKVRSLMKLSEGQLVSYIHITTKRSVLDFWKKNKHIHTHESQLFENIADTKRVESLVEKEAISFESLTEKSKCILYDRYIEELTITEISQKYKMTKGNVSTTLSRARDEYREKYGSLYEK